MDNESQTREAIIKNLSLQLLEIDTATQVLDLFEHHCITGRGSGAASDTLHASEVKDHPEILIENLVMMLLFFKTKL